jgi:hypothetical protein
VLDDYVAVVDGLGDDLAGLEDLFLEGDGRVTNRLYKLSREVAKFQRVLDISRPSWRAWHIAARRSPDRIRNSACAWASREAAPAG